MVRTTDNNCGNCEIDEHDSVNLSKIANVKISDIKFGNHPNLLVYPHCLNMCEDKISDKLIFNISNDRLTTNNIMGFVGVNDTELTIESRFASGDNDFFLHYMLEKVFSINVFDLKHSSFNENIFDFLIYLFPHFLEKALGQGVFKEYKKTAYNNANVRGTIDINRHLRTNIPFNGKVAHKVREHSYDNRITQLVRHTIEFIHKHRTSGEILNRNYSVKTCVKQIVQATPTYSASQRKLVMNMNVRPLVHPFYSEYNDLQQLCMQILRYDGLKYGKKDDKVYGLLFDGAWLWEEYLNTVLKGCGFKHALYKVEENSISLFQGNRFYKRYPDFWKKGFIVDAKYKKADNGTDRDDMHQIITYMYVLKADLGGFLYPKKDGTKVECNTIGKLNGHGGSVKKWSMPIPKGFSKFSEFRKTMNFYENELVEVLDIDA